MTRSISLLALTMMFACASSTPAAVADVAAASTDERSAARAQLDSLATLAVGYETANGKCPNAVEDLASPAPVDPWGSPVAFMPVSPENPQSAFVSSGPDKALLTADDITVPVTCSGR